MKITALVENLTLSDEIQAEHGLSLYIEVEGKKSLFDMGQTNLFAENAAKLSVDLTKVDLAILSHGHYDHGGGLQRFFEINKQAPVYINQNSFGEFFNGPEKYIGLDQKLVNEATIRWTDNKEKLFETMQLLTYNQEKAIYPNYGQGLLQKDENGFQPDSFRHEQYLLIEENGKRILVSGCSHKGIVNLALWARPDVVVGGFHLKKVEDEAELIALANVLKKVNIKFYTCHCTGKWQFEQLKKVMGSQLEYLHCGEAIEI